MYIKNIHISLSNLTRQWKGIYYGCKWNEKHCDIKKFAI